MYLPRKGTPMPQSRKGPREHRTHRPAVNRRAVALYADGLSCRVVARRVSGERGVVLAPQTVAARALP